MSSAKADGVYCGTTSETDGVVSKAAESFVIVKVTGRILLVETSPKFKREELFGVSGVSPDPRSYDKCQVPPVPSPESVEAAKNEEF
jgi:hypothetical protein